MIMQLVMVIIIGVIRVIIMHFIKDNNHAIYYDDSHAVNLIIVMQ